MMLSVSPTSVARSSLEEMLDSLRRRDEENKPRDLPPALPARPTSKARLPAARRSLPKNFEVDTASAALANSSNQTCKKEEVKRRRVGSFGGKKNRELLGESPYVMVPEEKEFEQRLGETDSANLAAVPLVSLPRFRESEWNDNIGSFSKKKLRVWCWLQNGQWELGHIQSTLGEKATVLLSDGTVVKMSTGELLPANPDILEGLDDLIQLSYLNEPSVLHNLQYRYSHDIIYSKAGPVLIAINPFKDVQCYGNDLVRAYREKLFDNPHVYVIADAAYNEMMRDEVNQSIIISGESGAGKTETAKIAMQYLAALGGGCGGVESEILQTSCILEAFGNAKTSRNDNSSRFGKLIEIHFSATGKICGAQIQSFLLEKSRVIQLTWGERSYHIFYQLCAGAPSGLKDRLNLKTASEYSYLNQSDCLAIDNVDDARKFQMLMEALDTIRISKKDQEHAFEMLAAVLWLGNISFQVIDNENHVEVVADEAVTSAARLMGCRTQDLMLALSTHRIQAGKDSVAKNLTLQQAIDTRDALAKFIYASLFDWLVEEINQLLALGELHTGRSISILDIYGFESFKKNSFEQLCINYANERLQQYVNRHLFKLEQEEYELDGIDWRKVDFEDNQECLDLFEKKPIGLLSLLDDESNFPKATDLTFANKLKQHLNGKPCFKGERGGAFSIHHYAGEVLYDTSGFLEKNRDPLHSDTIQLLSSCSCRLPQLFASNMLSQFQKPASPLNQMGVFDSQNQSVGTKFKGQLLKLLQQLESSTPHFIRCIKPNNKQLPGMYEKDLVLEQLRCCGVLEVVRIAKSGYPSRLTHQEFARRYGFLLSEDNACQDPLSISVAVLQQFDILPDMYQVGYTKLYFRTGQIAGLEDTRKQVLQGTLEVQKRFPDHRAWRHLPELKKGVVTLQSFIRGENGRRECDLLKSLREQAAHKTLEEQLRAIIRLQSVIRGWLARRHFIYLQRLKKSNLDNTIQKPGRKFSEVKELLQERGMVLPLVLEELQRRVSKAEATLGQKEQENAALREQLQQYEMRWSEYEAKMKSMEEMWQKQMASLQVGVDKISPLPGSVPSTTLPLTFFDIPWLLFTPSQPLFFYEFPYSTTHFTHSILPTLKRSLSLTLQHFFPLAGNLTKPPQPTEPHLIYTDGDSISLTIAESAADFNHLSGHHPRDVEEFHHLVPLLPPSVSSDPHLHPLLAIQVTVFSNCGICMGFSFHHVVADGRTFNNLLKTWASICRMGLDPDLSEPNKLLPLYDRSVIKDPNGLQPLLLKQWWNLRSSHADTMERNTDIEDMVRATFVVGRPDMEKVQNWILTRFKKIFGSHPLYLSPYVVTCAYIWVCLIKVHYPNKKNFSDEPHYLGFIAGGITRLDYPVPASYYGNCVSFGRSVAMGNELMGENGIVFAAKAIGDTVKKLNGAVLGGAESWISDWKELFVSELHVMVFGSPKLDHYGLDFGWGRPKKIEEISIDRTRAVSLTESREVEGGIEVGLALPKAKMDAFCSLFFKGLNGV